MNDWRGTPITVGSRIVYPGRQSSSMWMTEAVVEEMTAVEKFSGTKIGSLKVRIVGTNQSRWKDVIGKLTTITALERVTVIPGGTND